MSCKLRRLTQHVADRSSVPHTNHLLSAREVKALIGRYMHANRFAARGSGYQVSRHGRSSVYLYILLVPSETKPATECRQTARQACRHVCQHGPDKDDRICWSVAYDGKDRPIRDKSRMQLACEHYNCSTFYHSQKILFSIIAHCALQQICHLTSTQTTLMFMH